MPGVKRVFIGYKLGLLTFKIVHRASCLYSLLHFRHTFLHNSCRSTKNTYARDIFLLLVRIWLFSKRADNVIRNLRGVCKDQFLGKKIGLAERFAP